MPPVRRQNSAETGLRAPSQPPPHPAAMLRLQWSISECMAVTTHVSDAMVEPMRGPAPHSQSIWRTRRRACLPTIRGGPCFYRHLVTIAAAAASSGGKHAMTRSTAQGLIGSPEDRFDQMGTIPTYAPQCRRKGGKVRKFSHPPCNPVTSGHGCGP